MRRLFCPCGNAARQDVLLAADVDTAPEEESDYAAWAAYRKAKKKEKGRSNEERGNKGSNKNEDDGRTLNGLNRKMGERDGCYT